MWSLPALHAQLVHAHEPTHEPTLRAQPFILRVGQQDFGEWTHKVRTFMLARFGDQILSASTWAARQRKIVVKACGSSQRDRPITWIDVFGEGDQIDGIDDFVGKHYAYLCLLYNRRIQPDRLECRSRRWLGSLETTAQRVRPASSMRRVAIFQQGRNPPRDQRVEDLGSALGDWLSQKRQYEMFTDRDGRPCQASDDSLVAAMFRLMPKNVEETVMFTNEDDGFQELFDRLLAYSSTKQSVKVSESKRQTRRDDPMDIDALSKQSRKGKSKKDNVGSGKGHRGHNKTSNVKCWNCGKSCHYVSDFQREVVRRQRKRQEQRR